MNLLDCISEVVFWTTTLLIFHTYFGIFVWLKLFIILRGKTETEPADTSPHRPGVSVFIPAHNEENVIGQKVQNLLDQTYPRELLEIVVSSDCSTDRTVEILSAYSAENVRLIDFRERHGKLGMIDEVIPELKGEIVIVTDANVLLQKNAVEEMINCYSDENIGAVSGQITLQLPETGRNLERERTFRRFESTLKRLLGRLGIVTAVFGGFYSFRRELFVPIGAPPAADDIVVPLEILAQKRKVTHAFRAIGTEETASTIGREFSRRVRMTAYNLNCLSRSIRLSFRAGGLAPFVTISYKILRWLTPYLMLLWLISASLLAGSSALYAAALAGAAIIVITAILGGLFDRFNIPGKTLISVYHFMVMNLAAVVGLFKWLKGVDKYWNPQS